MPYRKLLPIVLFVMVVPILPSAALAAQGPESPAPSRQVQRENVFFQNDFLRVEVPLVAVSKPKNRVSFTLTFQSLSSQDIFLAVDRSYSYCRASVMDDLGLVVPTKAYGQKVFITGLPCLYGDGAKKQKQEYVKLSPGSRTSVVIAFENEDELFEGKTFSLSTELLKFDGDGFSKFSMGISGVKVPN
jgi:hypothetical protein